jgi:hypothetical protein
MKRYLCLISILLVTGLFAEAQEIFIRFVEVKDDRYGKALEQKLKSWKIYRFEGLAEDPSLTTRQIRLQLGGRIALLTGTHSPVTGAHTKLVALQPGSRTELPFPTLLHFNGKDARITVGRKFILGDFREGGVTYLLEQVRNMINGADENLVVVYEKTDVVINDRIRCENNSMTRPQSGKASDRTGSPEVWQTQPAADCRTIEIGVLANSKSFQFHGSSLSATASYIASIYNLCEGDYSNEFTNDFRFKINELVVCNTTLSDPWPPTDDINDNIDDFADWALRGFRSANDLCSFWFHSENFSSGAVGLAYLGMTCSEIGDAAIREYGASAAAMRMLVSHEHGHNFNLQHDQQGSPYIMAPSVNPLAIDFSPASKTAFEAYVVRPDAACITTCMFEDCERIAPANLSVFYNASKDAIQASWTKVEGSAGYVIRWWERDNPVIKSDTTDSTGLTYQINLSCSNTAFYRVEVARLCSNGQTGNFTGVELLNTSVPVVTPDRLANLCGGGEVLLTSSILSGNQWYRDGVPLAGETGNKLLVTTSGKYEVRMTGTTGCAYASNPVTVADNAPPEIPVITAAGPTAFCAGGSVELESSSDVDNQWLRDGVEIPKETGKIYEAASTGNYSVRVTNESGCVAFSKTLFVLVKDAPQVPQVTADRGLTLCTGEQVTLTSNIQSGNQWVRNNIPISGAVGQTYKTGEAGNYAVRVTNVQGCFSQSEAQVVTTTSKPEKPVITAEGPLAFCSGEALVLKSSSASGNLWFRDGAALTGASASSYQVTVAGNYTVMVRISATCFSISDPVSTAVLPLPPIPQVSASGPLAICPGNELNLTSSAAAANQWYKDNTAIPGATGQVLQVSVSGSYTVRVANTQGCSSVSAAAVVTLSEVPPTPVVTASGPVTFCSGASVELSSSAAGTNQWLKDGTVINGATASVIQVVASGGYSVRSANANGCLSPPSEAVTVTVHQNPEKPVVIWDGNRLAAPAGFAEYIWYRDGVEIPGAGEATLIPLQGGLYRVLVADLNQCSALSDEISLAVTGLADLRVGDAVISCYPNPARDQIRINVSDAGIRKLSMKLYDGYGRLMAQKILGSSWNMVEVGHLPAGIYHLVITNGTQQSVVKMVLVH